MFHPARGYAYLRCHRLRARGAVSVQYPNKPNPNHPLEVYSTGTCTCSIRKALRYRQTFDLLQKLLRSRSFQGPSLRIRAQFMSKYEASHGRISRVASVVVQIRPVDTVTVSNEMRSQLCDTPNVQCTSTIKCRQSSANLYR